jgi:hypothetical protein
MFYKIFITPLIDIAKYVVFRDIDTGDKNLNNLVACLVMAILTYFASDAFITKALSLIVKTNDAEQQDKYYLDNILSYHKVRYTSCKKISAMAVQYFIKHMPPHIAHKKGWADNIYHNDKELQWGKSEFYNEECNLKLLNKIDYDFKKSEVLDANVKIPVYIYSVSGRRLYIDDEFIYYTKKSDIEVFIDAIKHEYISPLQSAEKPTRIITNYSVKDDTTTTDSVIYPERNFENWVSRYKPSVENYIAKFKLAQKTGVSEFGGFGTYNLGIILYGEPGTGKTLFIKALANSLGRNVVCIKASDIVTNQQFKRFIKQYKRDNVLVFDEFDSIDGVVSRDHGKTSEKSEFLANLQAEKMKLLSMSDSSENVKKELKAVDKRISEVEDKLDIYSMLTELDGVSEHRGRVIVATTNYIDNIDKALLRPGRFDVKYKLERFIESETRELLYKMFRDRPECIKAINLANFKSGMFTPAEIMNLAMVLPFDELLAQV